MNIALVEDAKKLIQDQVELYKNPIVMSSFGKDSMVLLDLIKKCNLQLPILFHREPFFPAKYEFANRIILENNYVVYDYAPLNTGFVVNGEMKEIANFYQVKDGTCYLPTGVRDWEPSQDYLCGLLDLYGKPRGSFGYPWDLTFIGHKSSDIDPILGKVKLVARQSGLVFPLANFTDKDIWEYIEEFQVPYDVRRYDKTNGYKEFKNITFNPDYFPVCTHCMDRDLPNTVFCPKVASFIPNISALINYVEIKLPDYVGD